MQDDYCKCGKKWSKEDIRMADKYRDEKSKPKAAGAGNGGARERRESERDRGVKKEDARERSRSGNHARVREDSRRGGAQARDEKSQDDPYAEARMF